MCGIAGIWSFNQGIPIDTLERFTLSVRHRGPDAHDTYIDGDLGLGHTRLAILDLSDAGKCPMRFETPSGKILYITFNGEIYNFIELRLELEKIGYRFTNQTDTQVVVAAYDAWGVDCLKKFNGMWAFAIWDKKEKKLFLSRDRFGVKPLYFSITNQFAFASELKAFCSLDGFERKLCEESAPQVLQDNTAEGTSQKTLMQNVYRLLPGHYLTVNSKGQVDVKRWWDTKENLIQVSGSYRDRVQQFREIFLDSVRIRMRSDVPVGTLLSGGMDSSAVASSMSALHHKGDIGDRIQNDWQRTCIATFPGTIIDEEKFANVVVRHINANPTYWIFNDQEVIGHVLDSVWSMEEPAHTIATPVWCTYRKLRSTGVVVSLDGHGSDEMLGGYGGYLDWPRKTFNDGLYNDFHFNLLPAILRNFDRCSAAHGIEAREPFMDYRLVTYAFSLPSVDKVGGGFTKRILRDSMEGIVPDIIRERKSKIGFNAPMIEWFNGGLNKLLSYVINSDTWRSQKLFDSEKLGKLTLERCQQKAWTKEDWGATLGIWTKVNYCLWIDMFINKQPVSEIQNKINGAI